MPEKKNNKKVSLNVDPSSGRFIVSDITSRPRSVRGGGSAGRKKSAEKEKEPVPVHPAESPVFASQPSPSLEAWLQRDKRKTEEVLEHMPPPREPGSWEGNGKVRFSRPGRWKVPLLILGIAAFVAGAYVVSKELLRVEIVIQPRVESRVLDLQMGISASGASESQVPGEFMRLTKTKEKEFPASKIADVNERARGVITIYNNYSSASQSLVANTRFQSTNGKIFRIRERVTVPGASVKDGKVISPGVLEVTVYADQPGDAYNVGVTDFTIPGFQGLPQYKGFYAKSKTPVEGGFVGKMYVASEEDAAKAREELLHETEEELKAELVQKIPPDFKLLENSYDIFTDVKIVQKEATGDNKTFRAVASSEAKAIIFRPGDVAGKLPKSAGFEQNEAKVLNPDTMTLTAVRKDFALQTMSLHVSGNVDFVWNVDEEGLKEDVVQGVHRPADFENVFRNYHAIKTAEVVFSPPWVRSVPLEKERIVVKIRDSAGDTAVSGGEKEL